METTAGTAGITPDSPATTPTPTPLSRFWSSSHLWHRARKSNCINLKESGSRLFSFVSLSACLPCLTTKPSRNSSTSPIPQEETSFPTRPVEILPFRDPQGGSIPTPELVKAPHKSPPLPLKPETVDDNNDNEAIITISSSTTTTTSTPTPTITVTPTATAPLQSSSSSSISPPSSESSTPKPTTMADRTLQQILSQLRSNPNAPYGEASSLLSRAKIALLQLGAATPGPNSTASPQHLSLARDVYEQGALFSIRARNPDAFTRYVAQLQPFYELPSTSGNEEQRNKVTGLYLLLLLTQGRYAEFHSELETLGTRAKENGSGEIEGDRFLGYPIKLERWLMEGSYDRVWKSMKSREVPSEEYGVFSEILTSQIRSEIASSSERAYPSLPLSSTKSLLFLDSEGAVIEFAHQRGWLVRDGKIYFPISAATTDGEDVIVDDAEQGEGENEKEFSRMVIENALGYARELETIV
ncbi:SAC3/GANP/Nin1/mts3/eIF-3 p25 family-domain-containing protein [Hypoxylon trugodes]|uniref:SAC3/GANP/Nin1/mts3/eIF-3 p25 family-domain-containing protein n=1 Tax=Hypoxylon trugodes TaxID=326681 RepID=UPI00219F9016|nr:SAC3/GANP/Nin1/mts3/eIF-3 p25 family-domain-containing protein [Hypoxylon trugodes]KAI1385339.1 SAC3/GANP/Nin1/mts3/eIF-3 p25 family-domain-containing protein [Hypoxylon trugodes]